MNENEEIDERDKIENREEIREVDEQIEDEAPDLNEIFTVSVAPTGGHLGQRLDLFLVDVCTNLTRAEAQRLIEAGNANFPMSAEGVRVNGKPVRASYRMRAGDSVTLVHTTPLSTYMEAEQIPLEIAYEDADLIVINKPRGMVTHPAPGAERGTLVNALLGHVQDLSGVGGELRPGIVHRLDKDTGGLLVVAKNDLAHRSLQAQIQERTAERRYQALVWGVPDFHHATVDAPIGRHPVDRKKMAVVTDPRYSARSARTELTVLQTYASTFTLLEAKLHTGRTHQIRVHCAYIHHPIVGDPVYGGLRKLPASLLIEKHTEKHAVVEQSIQALHGQALHAYSLSFDHPRTGERLSFSVPLPLEMQNLLAILQTV